MRDPNALCKMAVEHLMVPSAVNRFPEVFIRWGALTVVTPPPKKKPF